MNESLTQTITVTTTPAVPGVPNTGFSVDTGGTLPFLAAFGSVLLLVTMAIMIVRIRHARRFRPIYARAGQHRRRGGFFSVLAVIGVLGALVGFTTHQTLAAASLMLTPQNSTVSVAQGSSVTVPTTATLHTDSPAGYTLTLISAQNADGVTATVKGGDIASDTSVTSSPLTLKTSTAPTAVSGDTVETSLTITANADAPSGTSDLTLTYQLTETPVPTPTTMQAMTQEYCTNNMSIYTGTNDDAILTLTDTRGGITRTYRIAKLADNKCWMLDNLKLGSTSGSITLTPSDSNVASNFTLPQLTTGGAAEYDDPRAYGPVPGDTGSGATNYGYLYNWSAATAGETRTSITTGNAAHSICAAGWRLPTGSSSDTGEFSDLDRAFGGNGTTAYDGEPNIAQWQHSGPFKGVFAGNWSEGFHDQGDWGYLWSSSAYPDWSDGAFFALFGAGDVYPDYNDVRVVGLGVRCLLN